MDVGGSPSTRIWYIEVMGHWDPLSYKKLVLFLFYCLFCVFFLLLFLFHLNFLFFFMCGFHVYKYNQIDKHVRDQLVQHSINDELKGDCLLQYDEFFK
jgi:hypothetical protein